MHRREASSLCCYCLLERYQRAGVRPVLNLQTITSPMALSGQGADFPSGIGCWTMTSRSGKIAAVAIVGLTVLVGVYSYHAPALQSTPVGCNTPHGYVLIKAGPLGLNESVNHPRPWPVVTFQKGETVNLFVCNDDHVSPHGFAIDHYLNSGVVLRPGESVSFSFMADQTGNFTIFCNVFCSVHPFMIGRLRITS